MKTVYLHIGTHKTGSTSIQRFLARADDALTDQGFLYPTTGRPDTDWTDQYGQHELYWSLVEKRGIESDQVWHELRREINAFPGHSVVLSAEGFEGIGTRNIRRILEYLQPHAVRVIVYLRPPVQRLRSEYSQLVKTGVCSAPFNRFVAKQAQRCNYLELVQKWGNFGSIESIDIRLFDKVREGPGLMSSFADTVGLDFGQLQSFLKSPINTSPPDDLVKMIRWVNKIKDLGPNNECWQTLTGRARGNVLDQRWPGRWIARLSRPFLQDGLISERAVQLLRNELEEPHRRFLERYVSPEDRTYLEL